MFVFIVGILIGSLVGMLVMAVITAGKTEAALRDSI